MREIKFRAWDKENKKMRPAYDIAYIDFIHDQALTYYDREWKDTPIGLLFEYCELMQYTGLKDKNGKEIFEGDIVKHLYHNEIFEVIWNEKSCSFVALYLGGEGRYSEGVTDKLLQVDNIWYEVIGNIYENHELLNSVKE